MSNKDLKIPAPSCYNEEYEYFPLVRVSKDALIKAYQEGQENVL